MANHLREITSKIITEFNHKIKKNHKNTINVDIKAFKLKLLVISVKIKLKPIQNPPVNQQLTFQVRLLNMRIKICKPMIWIKISFTISSKLIKKMANMSFHFFSILAILHLTGSINLKGFLEFLHIQMKIPIFRNINRKI